MVYFGGGHVSGRLACDFFIFFLRSHVSGLGSQVSGLRSQVSGLRSQVSGLGSIVSILFFFSPVPISIGFPFETLHLINVSSTYICVHNPNHFNGGMSPPLV